MIKKVTNSAERIKELLEYYQISKTEFAERTGLDKSVISLYVNGKREPRQDKLYEISQAYGVDPAWLMGLDVPMSSEKTFKTASYDEYARDFDTDEFDFTPRIDYSYRNLTTILQSELLNNFCLQYHEENTRNLLKEFALYIIKNTD